MKREVNTKFYCYSQNNSYGKFKKPAHYVIVEALNASDADRRAEVLRIIF